MAARSYAERTSDYAAAVVAGTVPACKLTIAACRRHLDDLKRAKRNRADFPFVFDAAEANRICGFVEGFSHVKGQWAAARQRIRLEDWQCFILAASHGWVERTTGHRRFRTVYIEVPRKNAKTTLSAPVALDKLTADGEHGAEVVVAATKKEQANIAFGIAQSMARKCEYFRTEFGVLVRAHSVLCLETDSVFKAIDSRGQTQDGANLHFALNDELHAWKGRDLYAVLETAMGSRAQPMMWNITTAGEDQSGVCYENREYLEKILKGILRDDRYFGIIYTVDEGDDIYAEATWRKANPNYGVSVLAHDMQALAHKAKNNPKSRGDFRMKRLNIWINAAAAYFDIEAWDKCADRRLNPADFHGEACKIGLDLASKRDINAKVRLFRRDDDFYLFGDFWLPRTAVAEGANSSYSGWEEEGFLKVTDGNVVDYDQIFDDVLDDARDFDLDELGFDPHQAYHLVLQLMKENVNCVEVRPTVLNFSEPMKELDRLAATGKLHHDGNPVLRWMMSNVVAAADNKDNVYPRKTRQENKIDGVIATLMALNLALNGEERRESVFGELARRRAAEAQAGADNAPPDDIDYAILNDVTHPMFKEMAQRYEARQARMDDDF